MVLASDPALERGVTPGLPLAEAKGLLQDALFQPADPAADLTELRNLAAWCQRFSPLVAIEEADSPESLLLEIQGCSHLHGGELPLARYVARSFQSLGYLVRVAVADTIGCAWAVSRVVTAEAGGAGAGVRDRNSKLRGAIVPSGGQRDALGRLPVELLRLPPRVVTSLREFDLRVIGQLFALPRQSLPSRFGSCLLDRLDQALGQAEELLTPVQPAEPLEARWSFDEPTDRRLVVEAVLRRLLDPLCMQLAARHRGIRVLWVELACEPPQAGTRFSVSLLQPSLSAGHLFELARLRLERAWVTRITTVRLEVTATSPLAVRQSSLLDNGETSDASWHLAALVERLSSRLGEHAVLRPRVAPDAQPELACQFIPLLDASSPTVHGMSSRAARDGSSRGRRASSRSARSASSREDRETGTIPPDSCADRPLCLQPRPLPIDVVSAVPGGAPLRFRWKRETYEVLRSWGPERIETGWWRQGIERDYYRVETNAGQRFWLFRQREPGMWFLHGVFD